MSNFFKKEIKTLVLSGGGIKAISFCGVFQKLKELDDAGEINLDIHRLCCVSAGAIFGLAFSVGYTGDEMKEELINARFDKLKDIKLANIFSKYGIDSGRKITDWLESLLDKKGLGRNLTFKEHFEKTGVHLEIVTTNLNKYKMVVFDYKNTPDASVSKAVRLSIGIPFMFTADEYNGDIYIDGGIMNNFPIALFNDQIDNVLGVKVISHGEFDAHEVNEKIESVDSYAYHVIACVLIQKEKYTSLAENFSDHTIYIHAEEVNDVINFSLSNAEKESLIGLGYKAASQFFFMWRMSR